MQGNGFSPSIHLNHLRTVNFAIFTARHNLSRHQILFLMFPLTEGLTTFKGAYFASIGIRQSDYRKFLIPLVARGYLDRLDRFTYRVTDKALQLKADIDREYNRRASGPFRWR